MGELVIRRFFAPLALLSLAWAPAVAVELAPWEGTAQAVPLSAELEGRAVSGYRVIRLPEHGVLMRNGAAVSGSAAWSIGDLGEYPLVYRHTAIGDLSPDTFALEAETEGAGPAIPVGVTVSPRPPPPAGLLDLQLWLDASLGSSVLDLTGAPAQPGTPVAAWKDRSPASNDAAQPAAELQPFVAVSADGREHLQAVRFSGGAQHLSSPAQVPVGGARTHLTYVATLRPLESGARYDGILAANSAGSGLFLSGPNALSRGFRPDDTNGWASQPVELGDWIVLAARLRTDRALGNELFVNGRTGHVNASVPELIARAETRIGDSWSAVDSALEGSIGEVLLATRALSWVERTSVERYLASKWGRAEIHDRSTETGGVTIEARGTTPLILLGGAGNDSLRAAAGDDVLEGGPGDDLLLGGSGADRFLMTSDSPSTDTVLDYSREESDEIDVTGALGEGADGGVGDHIRITRLGDDSAVDLDPAGAGQFASASLRLIVAGVPDLSPADLVTGIETSPAGVESLQIRLEPAATTLVPGTGVRLRVLGRLAGGRVVEIAGRNLRLSTEPRLGEIDHRGWLFPHTPGEMEIVAEFHGLSTRLDVAVAPTRARRFLELGTIDTGGDDRGNYQGIVFLDGYGYMTANFATPAGSVSKIVKLSPELRQVAEREIRPHGYAEPHIGAVDAHGGFLYATFMDTSTLAEPGADRVAGLARIDPGSLELLEYFDLSEEFGYLDAIAFDGGEVWLPTTKRRLSRMPMTPAGPDTTRARYYTYRGGIGGLQGVTIRDGLLYAVVENTTSLPEAMGIAVFPIDELVEDPGLDSSIPAIDHVRRVNVPSYVYPVRYPEDDPYHESFGFEPGDRPAAYLPYIPGGDTLVKLDLQICSVADPDADGDGFCGSADCDDASPAVFPGALEVCDGLDNDCDGSPDAAWWDPIDLSGDGRVDGHDLAWLGRAFSTCSPNPTTEWWYDADFDQNGCVDGADLAALAAAWGCRGADDTCRCGRDVSP